ncbi:MAG: hypothetical protein SNJ78_03840 [Spirochaetales bacterium]
MKFAPLILLFGLPFFPSIGWAQNLDVRPIEDLIRTGQHQAALEFLEALLVQVPDSSDLLYLKSTLLKGEVDSLHKAIQFNNWKAYKDTQARFLLAERYLLKGEADRCLRVLNDSPKEVEALPEYWYFFAKGTYLEGNRTRALGILEKGIQLFPRDPRLLTLYFRYKGHLSPGDSQLWEMVDIQSSYYLEALAEFIFLLPPGNYKKELTKVYYDKGGKDPKVLYSLLLLEENEASFVTVWQDFRALGGLGRIDLWEGLFAQFTQGPIYNHLIKELAGYSGWIEKDAQYDGVVEERRKIQEGKITSLLMDFDQDGSWDLEIDFMGNVPQHIRVRRKGWVHIYFLEYPRVEKIVFQDEEIEQEYVYGWPPFLWEDGPLRFEKEPVAISPLHSNSIERFFTLTFKQGNPNLKIEKYTKTGRIRKYLYSEGKLVSFLEEEPIRAGEVRRKKITFQDGVPLTGLIDLDGDGISDLRIVYSSKVGNVEYVEFLVREKTVFRESLPQGWREWDFNGDGKIDAREYQLGKGRKRIEYSPMLEGIFDIQQWVEVR